MKAIACPECEKDDQIRKVSSIYSEGRTGTVVTGTSTNVNVAVPVKSGGNSYVGVGQSNTTLTGMSQTGLSARLAPPPEPDKKGLGCWWLLLLSGAVFIIGFFAPIQSKRKIQMAVCIAIMLVLYPITSVQRPTGAIADFMPFATLIVLGAAAMVYVFYVRGLLEENPKLQSENLINMGIWGEKMSRWDKLYYCYRNDIVFDPDTGKSAPAGQISSLIN